LNAGQREGFAQGLAEGRHHQLEAEGCWAEGKGGGSREKGRREEKGGMRTVAPPPTHERGWIAT